MLHQRSAAFAKSRGFTYGQIGPVPRARVTDLVSFDEERPAGPSQRVPYLNYYRAFFCQAPLHVVFSPFSLSIASDVSRPPGLQPLHLA